MAPSRNRRPGFSRRAQYSLFAGYVLAVAGALVGAALLAVSVFHPAAFAALRLTVAEVTAPASTGIAAIGRGIAAVPDTIGTYFRVHDENAELRAELSQARGALDRARVMAYDNRRLRSLLKLREADPGAVIAARIVSSTAASTRRFGLLNAGSWQGVREGQPVRGPEGLVGRIVEVGPNTARVLLLTDAESIVPVRRTRDGRPALVVGRGDGRVDIRSVDTADAGFRRGDVFVTSGTGGIYTPGTRVARAVDAGREATLGYPFARPDSLDFALVDPVFMPPPPPPRPARP